MPLFVPILRLIMLFLNVYDSFKTLKEPPPSSRNANRPSVRAMTQRKRDMKGCLAVWIVWVSLMIYERILENIVYLFIPFYDEFKSLILIFLILTRARGSEPIYLHLIRPLLKPYTRTLDSILEVALALGDFLFALSTHPLRLAMQWYHRKFGDPEILETELSISDSSSSSDDVSVSTNGGPRARPEPTRKPSGSSAHSRQLDDGRSRRAADVSVRKVSGREGTSETLVERPGYRREASSSSHQIWHPPESSYTEEDLREQERTIRPNAEVPGTPEAPGEVDDWRKYEPFPSAYPPTPLVTTSRLQPLLAAASSSLQPAIEEEEQDFHQSLLPPHRPTNPSFAGDLSDRQSNSFGISATAPTGLESGTAAANNNNNMNDSRDDGADADGDSMSTDGEYEDDEDQFNVTLRTPFTAANALPKRTPLPLDTTTTALRLFVSPPSAAPSSLFSAPSRSSSLTTADNGSDFRTSVALSSAPPSVAPSTAEESSSPISADRPASLIGRKRARTTNKARQSALKHRVRQVSEVGGNVVEAQSVGASKFGPKRPLREYEEDHSLRGLATTSPSDTADSVDSASSALEESQDGVPPEEKRRKVTRRSPPSPRVARARRAVQPTKPIRSRIARHASPPPQSLPSSSLAQTVVNRKGKASVMAASKISTGQGQTRSSKSSLLDVPKKSASTATGANSTTLGLPAKRSSARLRGSALSTGESATDSSVSDAQAPAGSRD